LQGVFYFFEKNEKRGVDGGGAMWHNVGRSVAAVCLLSIEKKK
jgi:hypothetical protein